jgi:hypothetical protein
MADGASTRNSEENCREWAEVDALLALAARFPLRWVWTAHRRRRIAVRNETSATEMLVWVVGNWYSAEVEPGEEPERLARIRCPREAAAALGGEAA